MNTEPEALQVVSEAVLQLNKAEMENAVDVAKRYPRSIKTVKAKVLELATCDEETAKGCFFAKPVGDGKVATGPSIRLAEIAAASYSNIKYGSRVIDIGQKWVTVQGIAIDLESNLSFSAEIKRSIWSNKNGGYRYSEHMVETTTKAAGALAIRDAIFKVIPMGLFSNEMKAIKALAVGANSGEDLSKRVDKMLKTFKDKFKVEANDIIKFLEVKAITDINEDHLTDLLGLYNGINDKEFTVEEAFHLNKVNQDSKNANAAAGAISDIHGKKDK